MGEYIYRNNIAREAKESDMNDLTEQYLNKMFEDLQKEQLRLMNDIKSNTADYELAKDKGSQQQITLLTSLMMGALKLRNLRKKLQCGMD